VDLAQSRIVLTGAASGIGAALLARLATYPCQIVAADMNGDCLAETLQKIASPQAQIRPYVGDIGTPEGLEALFAAALGQMGRIDLFIANAGFAYYEKLGPADWGHIEQIYRVNVYSPIYAAQKMAELYGEGPYKMVITASTMGHVAIPGYSLYASTKAALHRFAEAYRFELNDRQKLMLVYPIATRTHFFDTTATIPFPSQTPDYVAGRIIRGIEGDKTSVCPSVLFHIFSLLDRFQPWLRRYIVQGGEARQLRAWLGKRGGNLS
jgi:short-subunit dehydrogenase